MTKQEHAVNTSHAHMQTIKLPL